MSPQTDLWRVAKVAEYLDVSKKRVYVLIREGRLESMRLSRAGIRVTRRSVEKFVNERIRVEEQRRRRLALQGSG